MRSAWTPRAFGGRILYFLLVPRRDNDFKTRQIRLMKATIARLRPEYEKWNCCFSLSFSSFSPSFPLASLVIRRDGIIFCGRVIESSARKSIRAAGGREAGQLAGASGGVKFGRGVSGRMNFEFGGITGESISPVRSLLAPRRALVHSELRFAGTIRAQPRARCPISSFELV